MNVYLHIPFCTRKCLYCDFYSVGGSRLPMREYMMAVNEEFNAHPEAHAGGNYSLYIGGGTPSLLPPEELKIFIYNILARKGEPEEFTIEVNPDDVTEQKAGAWKEMGVGRVSMGVQSLVDAELRAIGRRHDSATAIRAYGILRKYFANISLDLMFGLPGQTVASLGNTLDGFIAMRPEHISAYSLMYEERTALTRLRNSGKIAELPEEDCVAMFAMISDRLAAAGYEQYEISNYSLPGYGSKHNSAYWQGKPYLGLGPGAHSYDGLRTRKWNEPDLKRYIAYWNGDKVKDPESAAVSAHEYLDDSELAEEMIMTRLRTREGLDVGEFGLKFGVKEATRLVNEARAEIAAGRLRSADGRLILTKAGIMLSDQVISSLF